MNWVLEQSTVLAYRGKKRSLPAVADGWLVAYAHMSITQPVVTHESISIQMLKNRVLIPQRLRSSSTCDYLNTFEMLRQLGVQFDLRPTT